MKNRIKQWLSMFQNNNSWNWSAFIGFLAFLAMIGFFIIDAIYPGRIRDVVIDTLFWLVASCFCLGETSNALEAFKPKKGTEKPPKKS